MEVAHCSVEAEKKVYSADPLWIRRREGAAQSVRGLRNVLCLKCETRGMLLIEKL